MILFECFWWKFWEYRVWSVVCKNERTRTQSTLLSRSLSWLNLLPISIWILPRISTTRLPIEALSSFPLGTSNLDCNLRSWISLLRRPLSLSLCHESWLVLNCLSLSIPSLPPLQTFHEAKKHRQQQGGVISFTREEAFLVSRSECHYYLLHLLMRWRRGRRLAALFTYTVILVCLVP